MHASHHLGHRRPFRVQASLRATALALALSCALPGVFSVGTAHAQTVTNSTLYYRMGGGSPGGAAPYRGTLASNLSLSASARLNYSCGKFDIGLSWQNLMNTFSKLGTTITAAVQAGIAALPMYVFQRAQPGLYQLFQNYSAKADALIGAALKTCEEMEAMIKQGRDPYEEWVRVAKGDLWKIKASAGGDVVEAKIALNTNEEAQNIGVNWVFGKKAGGLNSDPLRPIRDLAIAGYNATLNKPTTTSSSTNYSAAAEKNARLVKAFPTPDDLARFSTEVLGDKRIYTCSQGVSGCPAPTNTVTAMGLGPKYEAEFDIVAPKLATMANTPPNATIANAYGELQTISAPGMAVSPQLLDALRAMPAETRSVATHRLAQELSMHRVIDKALLARAALLTGMSLPEVTVAGDATHETQESIDRLTHYIDDLMYEARIRKELTSETALAIMGSHLQTSSQSVRVPDGKPADPAPLENGRVKTAP